MLSGVAVSATDNYQMEKNFPLYFQQEELKLRSSKWKKALKQRTPASYWPEPHIAARETKVRAAEGLHGP